MTYDDKSLGPPSTDDSNSSWVCLTMVRGHIDIVSIYGWIRCTSGRREIIRDNNGRSHRWTWERETLESTP